MGQRIEIDGSRIVDDSIIFTTSRSLTGADGEGYGTPDEASTVDTFAAKLASDLFESDDTITRVYVASNVVVIRSNGAWESAGVDGATSVIEEFFLHY